ncbi:CDP-alcohol phosphatidyltransferase family protein [Flavicella sediminum]|uniref:CDP-alcohol phosphatidyltransferase family protein n=1 Tax=Flavicella sediminum TaxID=2585141 RepID=UPI0011202B49|nr:CDP-alcohol phosphatidyltransferase family protein [Flavicella sediminum]
MKKHIPNLITLGNLLAGTIAVFYAVLGQLEFAALFVIIGIVLDFFDGFAARILKVQGELGKQLDSMADMVTSGVVPGIVLFQLILRGSSNSSLASVFTWQTFEFLPFIGLLVTLGSAYRLANFNIDTRQSTSFIGLPTPANTLLIVSLPLIISFSSAGFYVDLVQNPYVLIGISILCTYLLNAEIPLFALKFKNFGWADNNYKFIFLLLSVVLLIVLKFVAIPLVILLYVLISVWKNLQKAE